MQEYNYYQKELNKINKGTSINIKLIDVFGSSTKYMNINKENIDLFIKFFEELKNRL